MLSHLRCFVFNSLVWCGFVPMWMSGNVLGQDKPMRFEHLSTQHGLSFNAVGSIVKDHLGFMWFATNDGLNRFDGYEFTVFKHDQRDSNSLSTNFLGCMLVDSDGILWIATNGGGLNSYDNRTGKFRRYPLGSGEHANQYVWALVEGRDGILWVGTDVLIALDRKTGRVLPQDSILFKDAAIGSPVVRAIVEDETGGLWLGTWFEGLIHVDRTRRTVTVYKNDPADPSTLSEDHVVFLLQDSARELWCGTYSGGLNRLNRSAHTFSRYPGPADWPPGVDDNKVRSIYEDHRGHIWIGTYGRGVKILEKETGRMFPLMNDGSEEGGIRGDYIGPMYEDDTGTLWVGTNEGVSMYDPARERFLFLHANSKEGAFPSPLGAICEDRQGGLWIGGQKGVTRYDRAKNTSRYFASDASNPGAFAGSYVVSIHEDHQGFIWFSTREDGVSRFDPRTGHFKRYVIRSSDPARSSNSAGPFIQDGENTLWLGTALGIASFDRSTDRLTYYGNYASVRRRDPIVTVVQCMLEERPGVFWLGTQFNGLIEYSPKDGVLAHFEHSESDSNSLSDNNIGVLHRDRSGRLWLGTFGGGVDAFDPESRSFSHITERQGLASNIICSMLEDEGGNLWISTPKGISVFDPGSMLIRNFGVEDQAYEFSHDASVRSRTGELIFANGVGLLFVRPSDVKRNPHVPEIVLTGFSVLNEPFPLPQPPYMTRKIQLNYTQNFFTFEFAALGYTLPYKNRYKYRLEGVDVQWVDAGGRRRANYTHLDPGSYVFRVMGSNNDGVWNEQGLAVAIEITPPFWETPWFRASVAIAVAGLILLAHNYRVNRLLELERVRVRIARDLHDELGSNLSGIALASRLVQESANLTDQERHRLGEVSDNANLTAEAMREIVWFINPEHDQSTDLIVKMKEMALSMLNGIDVSFSNTDDVFGKSMNLEHRRHVFLIYKEILNNIVKHARCSAVTIRLERTGGKFRMNITDNGVGFDAGQNHPGNGVKNLQARAREIGGTLNIVSSPRKGTEVVLEAKTT